MNVLGAIVAGLIGTAMISMVMAMAPKMGMPKMDIVGMLGSMFGPPNRTLGWAIHFMMGAIFALIYALLWSIGIGQPNWSTALVFGGVHWQAAGLVMGRIPMVHVGIQCGEVQAPGLWMINNGGMMGFGGGLIGHVIFGLVVVLVYNLF